MFYKAIFKIDAFICGKKTTVLIEQKNKPLVFLSGLFVLLFILLKQIIRLIIFLLRYLPY